MKHLRNKILVMKFGGTSVGSAQRIRHVAGIVVDAQKTQQVVVVISAMSKVTDLLLDCAMNASRKKMAPVEKNLELLRAIHQKAISELRLEKKEEQNLSQLIGDKLFDLAILLKNISSLGEITKRELDLVLSFGERMSICLLAAAIRNLGHEALSVEASDLLITDEDFGNAKPILSDSGEKTKSVISPLLNKNIIPVITGFIGATKDGTVTTLGRGGSDYSATAIAYCLDAGEIWIWKDVDGAMTADPKIVKNARTIPALSYDEAAELSYFGAKVLHPMTMIPASLKKIPIRIKNTFKPEFKGTEIALDANHYARDGKAISTIHSLSLITIQGKGMIGVPGVAARLFTAIADQKINVLFISQASSEFNISIVVRSIDGERAVDALKHTFRQELKLKNIEKIQNQDKIAIGAVVGEGLKGHPGIAGKIFSALGDAGVNIIAIAQGSSERNISFVMNESDLQKAVISVHNKLQLAK